MSDPGKTPATGLTQEVGTYSIVTRVPDEHAGAPMAGFTASPGPGWT